MEVLFEFKGSKHTIKCTTAELRVRVHIELDALGHSDASVCFAHQIPFSSNTFILQRFSPKWDTFVDVEKAEDVSDSDRVTVILSPANTAQKVGMKTYYYSTCL